MNTRCVKVALMVLLALATQLSVAQEAQRIALVIGNGGYAQSPLDNPVNDANAVSARLENFGFEVITATDANLATMQSRLVEFVNRIESGATAMIYYAGHGIQANGKNYLLPVDATFASEQMLRFEALEVTDVLEELERSSSSINLVVLDACRNNPFEAQYRGGSRGLAVMDAAAGTLIAYATAPGSVASDGDDGENGLYTREFLNALDTPGLKVEEVFKRVRINVSGASNGRQIPWESSSLTGDFVFNAAATEGAPLLTGRTDPMPTRPAPVAQPPVVENDSICDDLSGRWISRAATTNCESEFWLNKTGDDTYSMRMSVCSTPVLSTVTGQSVVTGTTLTTDWKAAPCSGKTVIELAKDCRTGAGEARVLAGMKFMCGGSAPVREELEFVGVQGAGGARQ